VHLDPVAADLVGLLVQDQIGERTVPTRPWAAPGATQDGPHPRHDLGERERLRHVVVAAHREAGDLVLGGVLGGEKEDRRADAVVAQPPGELEAVDVGQHDVEHDQVGLERARDLERLPAAAGLGYLETPRTASAVETASVIDGSSSTTRMRASPTADTSLLLPVTQYGQYVLPPWDSLRFAVSLLLDCGRLGVVGPTR